MVIGQMGTTEMITNRPEGPHPLCSPQSLTVLISLYHDNISVCR